MKNKGLAFHVHHGVLFEYCYDMKGRIDVIKTNKDLHEQPIRLKLLQWLSDEAIKELPESVVKANEKWGKTYAELEKVYAEFRKTNPKLEKEKANAKWELQKAISKWQKANTEWQKAISKWKGIEAWHAKHCGCKEWNGKEINFK